MKILVLDDDLNRLDIFKDKLGRFELDCAITSNEAIEFLKKNPDYEYIYLDHDLGGLQMEWHEDNCGMNVVDWVIQNNYTKATIITIHSYNVPRSIEMKRRLDDESYTAIYCPGVWNKIKINI